MDIPIIKIRRSHHRLIFMMKISIPENIVFIKIQGPGLEGKLDKSVKVDLGLQDEITYIQFVCVRQTHFFLMSRVIFNEPLYICL